MSWSQMRKFLKDTIEPKGKEAGIEYVKDGKRLRVHGDKEWGELLLHALSQVRAFIVGSQRGGGAAHPELRVYPMKLRSFTMDLLDVPNNKYHNLGQVTVGRAQFEIRGQIVVLEDTTWAEFSARASEKCHGGVSIKYEMPIVVECEDSWAACADIAFEKGGSGGAGTIDVRGDDGRSMLDITLEVEWGGGGCVTLRCNETSTVGSLLQAVQVPLHVRSIIATFHLFMEIL